MHPVNPRDYKTIFSTSVSEKHTILSKIYFMHLLMTVMMLKRPTERQLLQITVIAKKCEDY